MTPPKFLQMLHHKKSLIRFWSGLCNYCDCSVHFLKPGTFGRDVHRHRMVAHSRAQAQVRNVDIKFNHAYYTTLNNQEIQEYDQNETK